MSDDELMTVATFDTLMAAEVARGYLEREGIRCFLADAELVNTAWYLSAAMGGIKLQVSKGDFLTAERLLHNRPVLGVGDRDDYGLKPASNQITTQPSKVREPTEAEDAEDEAAENRAEALVMSASRAAIVGLFLCPPCLHLYSLYLLHEAGQRPEGLREHYRKYRLMTAIVDVVVVTGAALIVAQLFLFAFGGR
jgi:hypothetical protein